jgi:diguanylate cyclase (GGDEF)-like protein
MKLMGIVFLSILLFLSLSIQPAHLETLKAEEEKYYFEQGQEYYRAGNYELALRNFLQALELNPKNKLTLKYVNRTASELKRRKEQELLNQAIKDYQEENYEVALDRFVQVLDLNPRNNEATEYIQKIKKETNPIERVKGKVISEQEKREPEKLVTPEISGIAQDIRIIKREISKRKLEEPKKLPAVIPQERTPLMPIRIALFLLFGGVLGGAFFTYTGWVVKRRELTEKNLKLLENLSKTATNTEHKEEILDNILRAFMQTAEAKAGALLTIEGKTGDLVLGAGVELRPDIPRNFRFDEDSSVFAEILKITSPVFAAQTLERSTYENLLLFKEKPASRSSFLLVPLIYKNRNVGVVLLNSKRGRRNYLRQHRGIIETLASQAAIIVANIAYDRQVVIDGLTGLYVHWFFYQCLEKEISRAERQNLSLALLMVDLDYFKQFNDNYGHPMGDKALVKVSEILRNDLRDMDTVARYGGEEFAIILPGVDEKLAFRTAERIRISLESYRFKVVNGKFRLTLSIGISIYEKGLTAEKMVERADKALYWVKQHGRNQVKSWGSLSSGDSKA